MIACDSKELQIFSGNANLSLAEEIVAHLGTQLGKLIYPGFQMVNYM